MTPMTFPSLWTLPFFRCHDLAISCHLRLPRRLGRHSLPASSRAKARVTVEEKKCWNADSLSSRAPLASCVEEANPSETSDVSWEWKKCPLIEHQIVVCWAKCHEHSDFWWLSHGLFMTFDLMRSQPTKLWGKDWTMDDNGDLYWGAEWCMKHGVIDPGISVSSFKFGVSACFCPKNISEVI